MSIAERAGKPLTQEEIDKAVQDLIIACTEKIEHLTYESKPIDNQEIIAEVLRNKSFMWLYTQIKLAADNISNFI